MGIFPIVISGRKSYRLVSSTDKKTGVHSRIIWCCSWTYDSKYFITGSRDGKVAVWGHQSATCKMESPLGQYALSSKPLELPDQSVTALAVAPVKIAPHVYLVAIGLENGCINMYKWSSVSGESGDNWQTCLLLNNLYPFCSILMIIFYVCISSSLQCVLLIYVGCLETKIVHLSSQCPSLISFHAHRLFYIMPFFFNFLFSWFQSHIINWDQLHCHGYWYYVQWNTLSM